jgi:hypothetical protein
MKAIYPWLLMFADATLDVPTFVPSRLHMTRYSYLTHFLSLEAYTWMGCTKSNTNQSF